jgi:hypothetical protein
VPIRRYIFLAGQWHMPILFVASWALNYDPSRYTIPTNSMQTLKQNCSEMSSSLPQPAIAAASASEPPRLRHRLQQIPLPLRPQWSMSKPPACGTCKQRRFRKQVEDASRLRENSMSQCRCSAPCKTLHSLLFSELLLLKSQLNRRPCRGMPLHLIGGATK